MIPPTVQRVLFRNRHLLLLTIPFLLLPTRVQMRMLVEELAANNQPPSIQWGAIVFFASIPMLLVTILCAKILRNVVGNPREAERASLGRPTVTIAAVVFLLLGIASYTVFRVLYWLV